jgi:hypothetical protein
MNNIIFQHPAALRINVNNVLISVQLNQNPLGFMFLLSALFHNMFRHNWPSSGLQCVFKESALLSF